MTEKKQEEAKKDYRQQIEDLLSNYEDGWDIFKKADDWDYPLVLTEKAKECGRNLPGSWLELSERVLNILATEKYGLNIRENIVEVIRADQMLDAYTSIGMPLNYEHWSFGKRRLQEEAQYQMGSPLAYEIIINSDPAIAYCMETNTKTMMMLVIAHASIGHNFFFTNNHLFQQHTDAKEILNDLLYLKSFIRECEDRYGVKEVERILDSCHALTNLGVDRYKKPRKRSPQEEEQRRARIEEARLQSVNPVMDITQPGGSQLNTQFKGNANDNAINLKGEENVMKFIASYAPHLAPWQREIINRISDVQQYFYPQMQDKNMNEGCASFWHYQLMSDMYDMDLIDDGMYFEFIHSHSGVITQRPMSSINPYALGFAMAQDLKRICENPTDEDREWFKDTDIPGNPDWVGVLKETWSNYKDESYIRQLLSPKVIRDFGFFALKDDDQEPTMEVTAIHDDEGYRAVRKKLADSLMLENMMPHIETESYDYKGDRALTLTHFIANRRPLEEKNANEVLKHIYRLWQHPVILRSVDETGKEVKRLSVGTTAATKTNVTPVPIPFKR